MRTKRSLIGFSIVIVFLIGGYVWYQSGRPTVFSSDMVIAGNYTIRAGEEVILRHGSMLTISGDLTVNGTILCDEGTLPLRVYGNLTVNGTLSCALTNKSIFRTPHVAVAIIAKHIEFGKDSTLIANGHVTIASDASWSLETEDAIRDVFAETASETGEGARIGPLTDSTIIERTHIRAWDNDSKQENQSAKTDERSAARALLGGTWHIGYGGLLPSGVVAPAPPEGSGNILLALNLGPNGSLAVHDFHLTGPSGSKGQDTIGVQCDARGGAGGDAFRMRFSAGDVSLNNFTLELGNGGTGGNAITKNDCVNGSAQGGDGGESGNFKITATQKIVVTNFDVVPGKGGNGGDATAYGKQGDAACPGTPGGDATAIAGNGEVSREELGVDGEVSGTEHVHVGRISGGNGGSAFANPGQGGKGVGCNCAGGIGGSGIARGGKGGDADGRAPLGTIEAHGGDGGNATALGGIGGDGGSCGLKPAGGNGGRGGTASAEFGVAGNGTTANGNRGTIKNESGGKGGDGGDGCGPGKGGGGGLGAPIGLHGLGGISTCPGNENSGTSIDLPTSSNTGPAMIQAVLYHGKYLPLDQLTTDNEAGCGSTHWHARTESVRATDGTIVPDPEIKCGYGIVDENKPELVPKDPERVNPSMLPSIKNRKIE